MHAGLRSALFGSALPLAGYELAMDFRAGWYRSGAIVTRDPAALPGYGFVRPGAKFEDVGGGLLPVATNTPAIFPGVGYIARRSKTNAINNSSFAGAVAGNPGTPPTKTQIGTGTLSNGITRQIVATGTDPATGIPYIDYRFFGTASATVPIYPMLSHSAATEAPLAAAGDIWTAELGFRLLPGAVLGTTRITLTFDSRNDEGNAIGVSFNVPLVDNGIIQANPPRVSRTTSALPATNSARMWMFLSISLRQDETYDFTMRLSAPSLVRSPITGPYIATSNGPIASGNDDMRVTGPTPMDEDWMIIASAVARTSATLEFVERPFLISDGTQANRVFVSRNQNGSLAAAVVIGNTFTAMSDPGVIQAGPGRYVVGLRRRGGRYACFGRNSSGEAKIGSESAVVGVPPMTLAAPGAGPPGGSQPDAAVEFVGYRRGTFSDDQVRGMLAALA